MAEPRHLLHCRKGVRGTGHRNLGLWGDNCVIVPRHHALSFCFGSSDLGECEKPSLTASVTDRIRLPPADNNSHRCHRFKLSILLHFRLCLQLNVHILLGTSKHRQDNPRRDVIASLLFDYLPVTGDGTTAPTLRSDAEKLVAAERGHQGAG